MRNSGDSKDAGAERQEFRVGYIRFSMSVSTQMYSCSSQWVHKIRTVSVSHFTDRKTEAWEGYPASKGQN